MKIRGSFVTNSSSVSYIVTYNDVLWGIASDYLSRDLGKLENIKKIYSYIRDEIQRNGSIVKIGQYNLLCKEFKFRDDGDTLDFSEYSSDGSLKNADFSNLNDKDIPYMVNTLIMMNKLNIVPFLVFGVNQVDTY